MKILDVECYKNYFLVSFMCTESGNVVNIEKYDGCKLDTRRLSGIMRNFTTISFNGLSYDLPMVAAALMGATNKALKQLSDRLVSNNGPVWRVLQDADISTPTDWDHIDLIEVAPGHVGLKIYGGRMGTKNLQDLPYDPSMSIGPTEREMLRKYCVNDLIMTGELYNILKGAIDLRQKMSGQYGMDLRSKSDAQIAETVICSELEKVTGLQYRPQRISADYKFRYQDPKVLSFKSETLQSVFSRILRQDFEVADSGSVVMPEWLRKDRIVVAGKEYQMGIGGLHSCEKRQYVEAKEGYVLEDRDVASYYPNIILQQKLAPKSLGAPFLTVYGSLVERRLHAKHTGDKVGSDILKIAVNGSFGKLGSKYSVLYAPELLIQTTITGQLSLLMLIERLTLAGVEVMSANTDGIVIYYPDHLATRVENICFDWELDTTYNLETTRYRCVASRDVNNYVAVTLDGRTKGKGIFTKTGLSKNPDFPIISEAVAKQIADGSDFRETIRSCKEILKFVCVRRVAGGAVWRNEPLGRAVRFYLSTSVPHDESIQYAKNGNRVPKSAGAKPLMLLPETFPDDVDYHYYEVEAEKLLVEVGFV